MALFISMLFCLILTGPLLIVFGCYNLGLVFKEQFLNHHEQWVSDGKPLTSFWIPRKSHLSISSLWAYGKCQIKWLFITPSWLRNDNEIFRKLCIYRIFAPLGFSIFILALMILGKLL
jgi:hypothetical protein